MKVHITCKLTNHNCMFKFSRKVSCDNKEKLVDIQLAILLIEKNNEPVCNSAGLQQMQVFLWLCL